MRRAVIDWKIILAFLALSAARAVAYTPEDLYRDWPAARFVPTAAPCLRPAELYTRLANLAAKHPNEIALEQVGESNQKRPIYLLRAGHGERRVLLWSQMHGDEPSATPALLDLLDYLLTHRADPDAAAVLDNLTLLAVPMLNPDGAEAYTRENAQAIDINRDALNLATPEGQLLKALRDRYQPILGFNLHDQNRRRTVGDTGVLASNSVLAVSGDPDNTLTPGRLRAQRACVAIADALGRFLPGGLARYDDDFNPRAFGDNLTAWGTPVVLIESGGLPSPLPFSDLTRMNFVAILTVLRDLARDDLAGWDAARYTDIPENDLGDWFDVLVRGGEIRQPGSPTPYRADLPFDVLRRDQELAQCQGLTVSRSKTGEVGDARLLSAGRVVDATGLWIVAPFTVGIDGWSARRWLGGDVLERFARLGVAEVRWRVPSRHGADAEALADSFGGPRRARLSVQIDPLPSTLLRVSRPPGVATSNSLAALATALLGESQARRLVGADIDGALARLWNADPATARPPIAPERAATFLLLEPSASRDLDGRVRSVWIDGLEVQLEP
jgi:zinc carboxypeptidase